MIILLLIFLSVIFNSVAQILLKEGMNRIGYFDFHVANMVPVFTKIILNPFVIGGIAIYVFSITVWLLVLSRAQVSYAYPLASMGYLTTAIASYFLLNEPLTTTRLLGILVIMLGVFLITRS